MRIKFMFCFVMTVVCIYFAGLSASAQEMNSSGRNVTEMKMTTIPGLPTCALGSVQSGNPTNAASIIFAKLPAGCSIPWHWHTPTEHVMVVSVVVRMDMKDAKSLTLPDAPPMTISNRSAKSFMPCSAVRPVHPTLSPHCFPEPGSSAALACRSPTSQTCIRRLVPDARRWRW